MVHKYTYKYVWYVLFIMLFLEVSVTGGKLSGRKDRLIISLGNPLQAGFTVPWSLEYVWGILGATVFCNHERVLLMRAMLTQEYTLLKLALAAG
jgi:hypothetical protein